MAVAGRSHQPGPGSPPDLVALLTPAQVGDYLGVPLGTLANWRYQGRGPAFIRFGRHVRYRATDVANWVDQQRPATEPSRSLPKAGEEPYPGVALDG